MAKTDLTLTEIILKLQDQNIAIRREAAEALTGKAESSALGAMLKALNDEDNTIRGAIAYGLGRIPEPEAIEGIIGRFGDQDRYVRQMAKEAIIKIGKPAVDYLIRALKHRDRYVREIAAFALGEIGDTRALEPLTNARWDSELWVRERVEQSLTKIKNRPVGTSLKKPEAVAETSSETAPYRPDPFGIIIDDASLNRMESYFDSLTIKGKWWLPRLSFGKYLLKNKFSKAESVYAKLELGEKPIALFIDTHFGSAKKGFVIADKYFYYNLWLADQSKTLSGKIPLAKIDEIHFDNAEINGIKLPCIYINYKPFGTVGHMIKAEMDVLNHFFKKLGWPGQQQLVSSPIWTCDGEEVIHTLYEGIYGFGWIVTKVYITNSRIVALPGEMLSLKSYRMSNPDSYFNSCDLADIQSFALSKPSIHMDFINKSELIINFKDGNKVSCKGPLVNLVEMREWIEIACKSYIPLLQLGDTDEKILFKDSVRRHYQLFQHYFDVLNPRAALQEKVKVASQLCITTKQLILYRMECFSGLGRGEYNWQALKDTWKAHYRKPKLLWVYIPLDEVERIKITSGKSLGGYLKIELKGGLLRGLTDDGTVIPPLTANQYSGQIIPSVDKGGENSIIWNNPPNLKYIETIVETLRKVVPDKIVLK